MLRQHDADAEVEQQPRKAESGAAEPVCGRSPLCGAPCSPGVAQQDEWGDWDDAARGAEPEAAEAEDGDQAAAAAGADVAALEKELADLRNKLADARMHAQGSWSGMMSSGAQRSPRRARAEIEEEKEQQEDRVAELERKCAEYVR